MSQHEHEFEAAPGLPEPLPPGERLLWQGAPDWKSLAVHAFHLRKVAAYFALMLVVQASVLWGEGSAHLVSSLSVSALLAAIGLGLLAGLAWMTARTALYTLTDRRVVMRIGIVLTVTYNLPLKQLRAAALRPRSRGCADLALQLPAGTRIAWLNLWPHARPWALREPQPMLRSVPQAERVAELLAKAWSASGAAAASSQEVRRVGPSTPAGSGHDETRDVAVAA